MDIMNNNIFGIILVCVGLLLVVPFIPKIMIFLLGAYLIFLGIRIIKGPRSRFYEFHSKTFRKNYHDIDHDDHDSSQ